MAGPMRAAFFPLLVATTITSAAAAQPPAGGAAGLDAALRPASPGRHHPAYLEAQTALARQELGAAEAAAARVPTGTDDALELAWRIARAKKSAGRIGEAAAAWCDADPTGRACADAELYGRGVPATKVVVKSERPAPLAPSAPFPLALGRAGPVEAGFIMDSGASETVISTALARRLGLKVTKAAFPIGVAGGGAQAVARLAILPSLDVGPVRVENLPVLVVDLPDLEKNRISGIVSPQQAFDGARVTFDFARHRMRVETPAAPAPATGGITVPYFYAGLDLVVPARVGEGRTALFGLDTGMARACAVSTDYAPEAETEGGGSVTVHGAGGHATLDTLPEAAVFLGEEAIGAGACVRSPMRKVGIPVSGLLGNALWKDGRIVLDTVAHTVTLVAGPAAAVADAEASGPAGGGAGGEGAAAPEARTVR